MRLVAVKRVPDGARVGRDVMSGRSDAIPLLRQGARVTARFRDALLREGIHAIYIDDDLSSGIDVTPLVSEQLRREASRAVDTTFEATQEAIAAGGALPESRVRELARTAEMMVRELEVAADAALALNDLSSADAYTLQHSIDVAALGLLIAQQRFRTIGYPDYRGQRSFERIDRQLTLLGVGLLLHDIGKLVIPSEILNKPGRLDDAEWELMRRHPTAGVDLLRSDLISPLVKVVVRSHHERFDGNGYPAGLRGGKINEFARIAAVADVYDAVTSERVYATSIPAHEAVQIIEEGSGSAFDPEIVSVFRQLVKPYPLGTEVLLSDGSRGIVADVPRAHPHRPRVRVAWDSAGERVPPFELPLDEHPQLGIVDAGIDVAPLSAAA